MCLFVLFFLSRVMRMQWFYRAHCLGIDLKPFFANRANDRVNLDLMQRCLPILKIARQCAGTAVAVQLM